MAEKLKDIIQIPDIDLVVNIESIDKQREKLFTSFVLTDEVRNALNIILNKIYNLQGAGIFIKGNFGSGKSHFLSYLYILLNDHDKIFKNFTNFKEFPKLSVKKILLTKYPAYRSLEKIVLEQFGYNDKVLNRDEIFKKFFHIPTVLIIDELSEFLRSKENPALFYEDIRFLQYLGEFSFTNPLWIISSLQEWIEETGHISSSMFNRIKDRFTIKINLTSSHIEDIIDKRIILKKNNALKYIEKVYNNFRSYYPELKISFEDFRKTYPLHPITVRFLSGLTQIFSQHRGVIHFVVNEVKKNLDKNYDYLITADKIFDNFIDRIKEIPDYSTFITSVYAYYNEDIDLIIKNEKLTETALSVIKLLILIEISPIEKRKTAREIAEILLKKFSTFNENINYQFIKEGILEPLFQNRMFIKKEGEVYYVDSSIKETLQIKADLKKEREKFHNREFLFKTILKNLKYNFLPLNNTLDGSKFKFLWQNTIREVVIFPLYAPPKKHELERFLNAVSSNIDGYLCIISPFIKDCSWLNSIKEIFNNNQYLNLILFWELSKFSKEDVDFLETYFSKISLLKKYNDLNNEIKRDEIEFKELITEKFYKGKVISAQNEVIVNLEEIGILPFEKFLKTIFDRPLNSIHYKHFEIMPLVEYVPKSLLRELFNLFILKGKISMEEADRKGFTSVIENFLSPLGIISKRNNTFFLKIDAENELISNILNIINSEYNIFNLRKILNKGKWGLTFERFYILISILIVSGYVVPFNEYNEPVDFKQIEQFNNEIKFLKLGKTINHKYLQFIKFGTFIWGEVEDVPTFVTQKKMWKLATQFIREYRKKIERLETYISRYENYTIFDKINIKSSLLNNIKIFLNSLKISDSPSDGLEKFLSYLKDNNDFQKNISYIDRLLIFFQEEFQQVNRIYFYLNDNNLFLSNELEDLKKSLLINIEEYLLDLNNFQDIENKWNEFYEKYCSFYQYEHEKYYSNDIFYLKDEIEQRDEYQILKKISFYIPNLTFKHDFFEINELLKRLPEKCNENVLNQLFSSPVCKCGYTINNKLPEINIDFLKLIEDGLKNFILQVNLPENKEKIETFLLGENSFKDEAGRILCFNDISKINIKLIIPMLNDNILQIIGKALQGKWKIKHIDIKKKLQEIEGKRLKYNELKKFFENLLGNDTETIFWITETENNFNKLKENFEKYGVEGERFFRKISNFLNNEEKIKDCINEFNLKKFDDNTLIKCLNDEKIKIIKKHIRNEICHRIINDNFKTDEKIDDEPLKDILNISNLIGADYKYSKIDLFKKIIAPLNFLIEKVIYENRLNDYFDDKYIKGFKIQYEKIIKGFLGNSNKFEGAVNFDFVKNHMDTHTFIFDCLRFDLWILIKSELEKVGYKIEEYAFIINWHSDTYTFREKLQDKNILTWGEHITGKRQLKNLSFKDVINFNFIDVKIHSTSLDIYPLYSVILEEFKKGILPLVKNFNKFIILSDHGFIDTGRMENRYTHGGNSIWEILVPFAKISL